MTRQLEQGNPLLQVVDRVTTLALAENWFGGDLRAARDWCKTRRVPTVKDGKYLWCKLSDVMAALERVEHSKREASAVDDLVNTVMTRRHRR